MFGIQHNQVDLYQVCSIKAPGVKNDPTPGVKFYIALYRENKKKSSLKPQSLEP